MVYFQLNLILLFIIVFASDSMSTKIKISNYRMTNIKCTTNSTIYNGTTDCSIKPNRRGDKITNIMYHFGKPCNDMWVHLTLFYKYTNEYRQWMIDVDEDLCGIFGRTLKPSILVGLVVEAARKLVPYMIHSCPYTGWEGLRNASIDDLLSQSFPQALPRGSYRILLQFHQKISSQSFFDVLLTLNIDPVNPLDEMKMG